MLGLAHFHFGRANDIHREKRAVLAIGGFQLLLDLAIAPQELFALGFRIHRPLAHLASRQPGLDGPSQGLAHFLLGAEKRGSKGQTQAPEHEGGYHRKISEGSRGPGEVHPRCHFSQEGINGRVQVDNHPISVNFRGVAELKTE